VDLRAAIIKAFRTIIKWTSGAYTGQQSNYAHAAKNYYLFSYLYVCPCILFYVVTSCSRKKFISPFLFHFRSLEGAKSQLIINGQSLVTIARNSGE